MGYHYTIMIGLFGVSKEVEEDNEKYKELLLKLIKEFKEEKDLCFGKDGHSGSRGLGCGEQDWWMKKISSYSKKFPDITLEIYLSYWDYTNLNIYRFKNGKQILSKIYDFESEGIDIDDTLLLFPKLTQETLSLSVTNNITPYFTGDIEIDENSYFGEDLDY